MTTRDESGALTVQGSKQTTFGGMAADGPPTTMSDTGVDRLAFLQANLARDATYFQNGTPIGARDLFQVPSFSAPFAICVPVSPAGTVPDPT